MVVQVYVDDIIFGSTDPDLVAKFVQLMENEFQMSMVGEFKFFLGLQATQGYDGTHIFR